MQAEVSICQRKNEKLTQFIQEQFKEVKGLKRAETKAGRRNGFIYVEEESAFKRGSTTVKKGVNNYQRTTYKQSDVSINEKDLN